MNEERQYTKLSNLVDQTFSVTDVYGYNWQSWDNAENRMVKSNEWQKGFTKKWQVNTNKGHLDLGSGQMGTLLEAIYDPKSGGSALVGQTFQVKSNGKTGMEIRYYFNPVREMEDRNDDSAKDETVLDDIDDQPVDLGDIPF